MDSLIHSLPVVRCRCGGPNADDGGSDSSFVKLGLIPSSFTDVRTVFTEDVLFDFRITNLECKVSAYQYYQKLRRITNPAFPDSVLNRYQELRRASRMYRNLALSSDVRVRPESPGPAQAGPRKPGQA